MSYNLDGKIANQYLKDTFTSQTLCERCSKIIDNPVEAILKGDKLVDDWGDKKAYTVFTYVGKSFFIYESKSGKAVCYCSDYCRRKHNHRFKTE